MAYRIELLPSAARQYRSLPRSIKARVRAAVDGLATEPRPTGARKLIGTPDYWRIRIADYRVLYKIRDRDVLVLIIAIGHRREVYRR